MRIGLATAAVAAVLLLAAPGAQARTWHGPCLGPGASGPTCTWWSAKVTFISDGDTVRVLTDGVPQDIRFIGINAMELHRYSKYASRRRGECHGLAATAMVEHAIRASHWRVRLSAQHASSRTGHRLRRSVWAHVGGRWRDLSRMELAAGQVLWLPNGDEWAHNRDYHELAERAARAHRRLYDPRSCGSGPSQATPISIVVNWDADGSDSSNLNGEYVDIFNGGTRPLRLGGWWFRDSWLNYDPHRHVPGYAFRSSAVVPAHGSLRLHMGCGRDSARELHWCQHSTVFENVTHDATAMGDGGYLFDPDGDLRASMIYPCVVSCRDPLLGEVELSVEPTAPEEIRVYNVADKPVDLGGHLLKLGVSGSDEVFVFGYPFLPGTVVQPRDFLRIVPDGRRGGYGGAIHLGRSGYALADGGGLMELVSATDVLVACDAWGYASGRCPGERGRRPPVRPRPPRPGRPLPPSRR